MSYFRHHFLRIKQPLIKGLNSLFCVVLITINLPLAAHEFWILADDFSPDINQTVSLRTEVGQVFVGDDVPNIEEFYSDYSVLSASGREPIQGNLATSPPAYFETTQAGSYIVGQRTLRSVVELEADEFVTYLKKQGMEYIIPRLTERNLDGKLAKEAFSRCAKAIVQTSEPFGKTPEIEQALLSTPLNYSYEIIPLSNPRLLKVGETFKIRLEYEGQPQANAEVLSISQKTTLQDQQYHGQRFRSNNRGIVEIPMTTAGIWMFSAVHMEQRNRYEADWESFWANLTFKIKP